MKFGYIGIDYKHADRGHSVTRVFPLPIIKKIVFSARKTGKAGIEQLFCVFRPAIAAKSIFLHRKRLHSRPE